MILDLCHIHLAEKIFISKKIVFEIKKKIIHLIKFIIITYSFK